MVPQRLGVWLTREADVSLINAQPTRAEIRVSAEMLFAEIVPRIAQVRAS